MRVAHVFGDEELNCILTDDTKLNNFAKTTYYALFLALQKEKSELDKEFNPKLENITFKWSLQDMSLKMCLLGNFLETYFMPIHLDLYHSTIEDLVFTNTIKVISNTTEDIYDFVNSLIILFNVQLIMAKKLYYQTLMSVLVKILFLVIDM